MKKRNKRTLFLTLKRVYFDQIKAGTKNEEYRQIKPWSDSRLLNRDYDYIEFVNGYEPDSDRMIVEFKGYIKKWMNYEGIFQEVYAIQLGDVISITEFSKAA